MGGTHDNGVPDAQGAALNEHGCNRTTSLVEVRFDRDTTGRSIRVRLEGKRRIRSQEDRFKELTDTGAFLRRNVDEHDIAAVILSNEPIFGQLTTDLIRGGAFLIDLVDRDHDRHVRCLSVVDRLNGLGHHAVIGSDHEDRNVGDLRATGAHRGEGLVTGSVDESNRTSLAFMLDVHLVGADVLGDAAMLGVDDIRMTNRVEELGLAVVDVAHDRDDRRTRLHVLGIVEFFRLEVNVEGLEKFTVLILRGDDLDVVAEFSAESLEGVLVERLGRGRHFTEMEEDGHQCCGIDVDLLREVGEGRPLADTNDLPVAAGD